MNFKFTKLKVIISVLVIILLDLLISLILRCVPYNLKIPTNSCTSMYAMIFEPGVLIIGLIGGIVIYLVWSFIQRKQNSQPRG
ncbi:MAG: hypothetical protein WCW57_04560 [Candidatus Pacearchaeota archaeon]|jgi:hypothetical protein